MVSCLLVPLLLLLPLLSNSENIEEEKYGVKYASDCEVCKVETLGLLLHLLLILLLLMLFFCCFPCYFSWYYSYFFSWYYSCYFFCYASCCFSCYASCCFSCNPYYFLTQVMATEFKNKLEESKRTHDVIETGYSHTK